MESYQNALSARLFQSKIGSMPLDDEGKMLQITNGYIERLSNKDDYTKFRTYMTNKFGNRFDMLPEKFDTEEEFQKWQMSASTKTVELLKLKQGQPITIHKVNKDGTTSEIKVTGDQLKGLQQSGIIKIEGPGTEPSLDTWKIGSVEGTPWKTPERLGLEAEAKKSAELKVEKEAGILETSTEKEAREKRMATFKGETAAFKTAKEEIWETPYVDETSGALLQKESKTGKIKEIAKLPEPFTPDNVQTGFNMKMNAIKTEMAVDMTPDEQTKVAGATGTDLLALLLSGGIGKNLSPEKKKYYQDKIKNVTSYYENLYNQSMRRKGANIPETINYEEMTPQHKVGGQPARYEYKDGKLVPK